MNLDTIKASFNTYFVDVLKNHYVDFKGQATRKQFWMYCLYVFVVTFVIAFVLALVGLQKVSVLLVLAFVLPNLGIAVRRIRDLGISGWFILVALIPFVGGLAVLVGYCLPTGYLKPYYDQLMQKLKK